ncbi:MAG: hypothetical protein WKF62_05660 [Solirubrobacterales bacterium]
MTWTMSRAIGISTALLAACLGALLLSAANQASAGGGQLAPRCDNKEETVKGLTGTNGDDVIVGTNGDDVIDGRGGKDLICGKAGQDDIFGGGGADRIRGGDSSDLIKGQGGDDKISGNGGGDDDRRDDSSPQARGIEMPTAGLFGGPGDDIIGGGSGDDLLLGEEGTDTHIGATGFDTCFDEDPDSTFISCEFVPSNGN